MLVKKTKRPFYTHALINKYYIDSAYKLVDGSYQIATSLAENIKDAGGDVFNREKVCEIISKDGKIIAVKTEQGKTVYGKQFISNIHPSLTIRMLDDSIAHGKHTNSELQILTTPFLLLPFTLN